MSDEDRDRWDRRYAALSPAAARDVGLPAVFAPHAAQFPESGAAIDLACGRGAVAVWLAARGMSVTGYDVSPVAISQARALAEQTGVAQRCRFAVADLDDGIPAGAPADVIVCHKFRDPRLDDTILARLAPGGLLAVSALSEVGAQPGAFRVKAGELPKVFGMLEVITFGESEGETWLLARG